MIVPPRAILVDRRNYESVKENIRAEIAQETETGIDLETDNRNAHAGIHAYSNDGVFDLRRQVITGLSLYAEGGKASYYFNLFHKDEENRLTWEEIKYVLDAKNPKSLWITHNAPFEVTMLKSVHDFELTNYLCTLQMAVSAYNQDEYDKNKLFSVGLGGISKVLGVAAVEFSNYGGRNNMTSSQFEVFNQVVSKQSRADHSYNGLSKSISYGYGLKQAVKSHFGFEMTTYKDTLNGRDGMMDLTGPETTNYGADDAFWCVKLFFHLKEFMLKNNPESLKAFLTQELPMVQVYSDSWRNGMRVNFPAVKSRREVERGEYANRLRALKTLIKGKLPFDKDPHPGLLADDKKYGGLYIKYRDKIAAWARKPESNDDLSTVMEASGAVADAWATEMGRTKGDVNFSYYMTQRVIMYDLLQQKCIKYKGAVQSDGESRGKLLEKLDGDNYKIVELLNQMTSIEQRMKLYLNPYMQLADPETGRIYPQLTSQLNTRRMAMSYPNPQQLAKRGESTYVRGFYLPDKDDEVIVSLDWSSFELVIIGELSKDSGFKKAFGQLPFGDLHTDATVNCLQVTIPEITLDIFKKLHLMKEEEIQAINPKILVTPDGKPLTPKKAKSYWRTEVGKGANFNYFYSGALSTVGEKLGWSSEQMWEATDRYRQTFPEAEEWRVDTIKRLQRDGYVTLPDGHRRTRFEATSEWAQFMLGQFTQREQLLKMPHKGLSTFGREVVKAIQTRANNQGVNALIQGTNATCAKRSAVRVIERIRKEGIRARFMCAIHDELVFSVHRSEVVELIRVAKEVMTTHPDIFETLKLDCTASVGRTFEPYDSVKAPFGQIELDEIQTGILDIADGSKVSEKDIKRIVDDYLFA